MSEQLNKPKFDITDEVIWDSGSGYDIGTFIRSGPTYYHYTIRMRSGVKNNDDLSVLETEVKPYSKELIQELSKKYGYLKDFN